MRDIVVSEKKVEERKDGKEERVKVRENNALEKCMYNNTANYYTIKNPKHKST